MDAAASTQARDEVRQTIESWLKAVRSLDVDAVMAHYDPDTVAFDAIMQLQFKGKEAYGKHWKMCLEMCPGPMVFEPGDLDIQAAGDLAVAYGLLRCGGQDENGQAHTSWMRMSASYRKTGGKWLIAHEHFSAPFDMFSSKALFDLDPEHTEKVRAVPPDMHTVTPHLVCANAAEAIDFYKRAFGATEQARLEGPDGKIAHACLRIGNSAVFLFDENPQWGALGPLALKGTPVSIHLYVDNADEAAKKAVAAGAKSIMEVQDMFWGDRYGLLEDPYGHRWSVATHVKDLSPEEIKKASETAFTEEGCPGGDAKPGA